MSAPSRRRVREAGEATLRRLLEPAWVAEEVRRRCDAIDDAIDAGDLAALTEAQWSARLPLERPTRDPVADLWPPADDDGLAEPARDQTPAAVAEARLGRYGRT